MRLRLLRIVSKGVMAPGLAETTPNSALRMVLEYFVVTPQMDILTAITLSFTMDHTGRVHPVVGMPKVRGIDKSEWTGDRFWREQGGFESVSFRRTRDPSSLSEAQQSSETALLVLFALTFTIILGAELNEMLSLIRAGAFQQYTHGTCSLSLSPFSLSSVSLSLSYPPRPSWRCCYGAEQRGQRMGGASGRGKGAGRRCRAYAPGFMPRALHAWTVGGPLTRVCVWCRCRLRGKLGRLEYPLEHAGVARHLRGAPC